MPAFPMRNSRQLWVRTHAPDAAPHSPRGSHKQAGVRDPGRPPSHPQGRAGPQGGECGSPGTSLPSPRPWRGNGGAEWRPAPARAALGVLTQRRPKPWGHPPPRNPALSAKPPAAAVGAKPSALTHAAGSPGGARGPEAPASPTAGGRLCRCRRDRHRPLLPEPGPGPSPHRRQRLRPGPGSQQPGTPDPKVCASVSPLCEGRCFHQVMVVEDSPEREPCLELCRGACHLLRKGVLGTVTAEDKPEQGGPQAAEPTSPTLPPPPVQARSAPARACTCPVSLRV